jgi:hypothetical protein
MDANNFHIQVSGIQRDETGQMKGLTTVLQEERRNENETARRKSWGRQVSIRLPQGNMKDHQDASPKIKRAATCSQEQRSLMEENCNRVCLFPNSEPNHGPNGRYASLHTQVLSNYKADFNVDH